MPVYATHSITQYPDVASIKMQGRGDLAISQNGLVQNPVTRASKSEAVLSGRPRTVVKYIAKDITKSYDTGSTHKMFFRLGKS